MKTISKIIATLCCSFALLSHSQLVNAVNNPPQNTSQQQASTNCSSQLPPFRDLDFLIGDWEFFTQNGIKIADQHYSSRGQGCLILEDWKELSGATGTGMNFVDPSSGKWQQVWMSADFHINYSGGMRDDGSFVLEGRIFPNSGAASSLFKGIYSKQADGSVIKEFLIFSEKSNSWQRFFIGVARRKP
ncbi:hypothetical protein [Undibacterium flavidum]|uniref:DUF1579 domain-containing protein n=1 Tax=Undibacterium flavidum TaxID=2762297 RepID=A0ABR6YDN6_9BURK|nr:hypothetical protein [Undibacterium flavidum]MBC3874665.1 hypothetical protein [Undibacterium flavidum]